jgi:multidrug efflux system membrane fusion protein
LFSSRTFRAAGPHIFQHPGITFQTTAREPPLTMADSTRESHAPQRTDLPPVSERERRNWVPIVVSLALIVLGIVLFRFFAGDKPAESPAAQGGRKAVPAATAVATQKAVPIAIAAIGSVEAYNTVAVRSQVEGTLTRVAFEQGQYVQKGALLFTVDARPNAAAFAQAEAQLSRDQAGVAQAEAAVARDGAQLRTAQTQVQRYRSLVAQGAVSQEQFDQVQTNAEALAATVRASEAAVANARSVVRASRAAVESARVQLGYTEIRAPIAGRTGSLAVYAGNLVRANDTTPLVVINRVSPIYVSFTVPERELPAIKRYQAQARLKVVAVPPSGAGRAVAGYLSFIDNAVDSTTGTIRLRGTFENQDNYLVPGQFMNVALTLTTQPNAVVVPTQAVQTGQQGTYVYVVKPDRTVDLRVVTSSRTVGGDALIERGVAPGETVVTDGQLQLKPGDTIKARSAASTPSTTQEPRP